jgi:hypothetical protein
LVVASSAAAAIALIPLHRLLVASAAAAMALASLHLLLLSRRLLHLQLRLPGCIGLLLLLH